MSTTGNASLPDGLLVKNREFGVLLVQGLSAEPTFETPHGTIQVLEIVILFPHELAWIVALGNPARVEMMRRLKARNERWPSSADQKPLVDMSCPIPTNLPSDPFEAIRVIQETWPSDEGVATVTVGDCYSYFKSLIDLS